ncbi:neuronal PAS domain-containing protein 2-like [Saccoglossus kowalevskii]
MTWKKPQDYTNEAVTSPSVENIICIAVFHPIAKFGQRHRMMRQKENPLCCTGSSDENDRETHKRKIRNANEKKRRDQFNVLIDELCVMVSADSKKMDKSAVLKATIAFLKHHNEVVVHTPQGDIDEKWKPPFLSDDEFGELILESSDGFILCMSDQGRIVYASDSITNLLGLLPTDYRNSTIYDLIHEKDRPEIYKILAHANLLFTDSGRSDVYKKFECTCNMLKGSHSSNQIPEYEPVNMNGNFSVKTDSLCRDSDKGNIIVALVRLQNNHLGAPIYDRGSEFVSRHNLEWNFILLDPSYAEVRDYTWTQLEQTSDAKDNNTMSVMKYATGSTEFSVCQTGNERKACPSLTDRKPIKIAHCIVRGI